MPTIGSYTGQPNVTREARTPASARGRAWSGWLRNRSFEARREQSARPDSTVPRRARRPRKKGVAREPVSGRWPRCMPTRLVRRAPRLACGAHAHATGVQREAARLRVRPPCPLTSDLDEGCHRPRSSRPHGTYGARAVPADQIDRSDGSGFAHPTARTPARYLLVSEFPHRKGVLQTG